MRLIACAALIGAALGQPPDLSPRFEVASIREGPPPNSVRGLGCWGGPGTADPERRTCLTNLSSLVALAYGGLKDYQFSPAEWMQSVIFEIDAVVPRGATEQDVEIMERNLLVERFHLRAHFEQKQTQIYEITVGANGPKFHEWTDEGPLTPEQQAENRTGPPRAVTMVLRPGDDSHWAEDIYGNHSLKARFSMWKLADFLSAQVGRPVINSTGLTGTYNIMLDWVGEPARGTAKHPAKVAEPESLAVGPDLAHAVQAQLGLKLESKKGAIEVLLLDQVERTPTDN